MAGIAIAKVSYKTNVPLTRARESRKFRVREVLRRVCLPTPYRAAMHSAIRHGGAPTDSGGSSAAARWKRPVRFLKRRHSPTRRRHQNSGTSGISSPMMMNRPWTSSPRSLFGKSTIPRDPVVDPGRDPRTNPIRRRGCGPFSGDRTNPTRKGGGRRLVCRTKPTARFNDYDISRRLPNEANGKL